MTTAELNTALAALDDQGEDISPAVLWGSGKVVPYMGWYWRPVDFDGPIRLAYADGHGFDVPAWVGFCENNKWGYPQFTATAEQSSEIRRLCEALVTDRTKAAAEALFGFLQSLRPIAKASGDAP